jgi:hypothetical protein
MGSFGLEVIAMDDGDKATGGAEIKGPGANSAESDDGGDATASKLTNPIVVIALAILASVFVFIGSAILSWDRFGRALRAMAEPDFARGLITYLFATVTIGTAMVLVVFALIAKGKHQEQFQRSKEILSLLLGVFGTMLGYYFGAEGSKGARGEAALEIAVPKLSAEEVTSGQKFKITTVISGGRAPVRFGAAVGEKAPDTEDPVDATGWVTKELEAPAVDQTEQLAVIVVARDASGHKAEKSAQIRVKPR